MLTHGIPPDFPISAVVRHRVSPEFIWSRNCVPMAFTAESPVVLKVVPVTGAVLKGLTMCVCVCVCVPFILDVRLRLPVQYVDALAGVTHQEESHTGVFPFFFSSSSSPPSLSCPAVRALLFFREKDSTAPLLCRILCTHEIIYHSPLVGHDVRENPRSCDCAEIRTHVPTSEGFEVTN